MGQPGRGGAAHVTGGHGVPRAFPFHSRKNTVLPGCTVAAAHSWPLDVERSRTSACRRRRAALTAGSRTCTSPGRPRRRGRRRSTKGSASPPRTTSSSSRRGSGRRPSRRRRPTPYGVPRRARRRGGRPRRAGRAPARGLRKGDTGFSSGRGPVLRRLSADPGRPHHEHDRPHPGAPPAKVTVPPRSPARACPGGSPRSPLPVPRLSPPRRARPPCGSGDRRARR